jgi:hypothetical protein
VRFSRWLAEPLQGAQVDQYVDQRIEVGDGSSIAEFGTLDTQFDGLTVDPLGGGTLLVDGEVVVAVPVEGMLSSGTSSGYPDG